MLFFLSVVGAAVSLMAGNTTAAIVFLLLAILVKK